jgi:hypothetical protein
MKVLEAGYKVCKPSPRGSLVPRRLFRVLRRSSLEWDACPRKVDYKPPTHLRVLVNNFGKDSGNNT